MMSEKETVTSPDLINEIAQAIIDVWHANEEFELPIDRPVSLVDMCKEMAEESVRIAYGFTRPVES